MNVEVVAGERVFVCVDLVDLVFVVDARVGGALDQHSFVDAFAEAVEECPLFLGRAQAEVFGAFGPVHFY